MRRSRSARPRKPTRRFDPTALSEVLRAGAGLHASFAVVAADDDGQHFHIERGDDGSIVDLLVDLVLVPSGATATARWSRLLGGPLRGIFAIPAVGEEFLVTFVDGNETEPIAMAALGGGALPTVAAEATASNVIICGPEVIVTDADGGSYQRVAREGDAVRVSIPIGAVVVAATGATTNVDPIELDGTIVEGSDILRSK